MTTTPAAAEQSMEYYFLFVTASSKNNGRSVQYKKLVISQLCRSMQNTYLYFVKFFLLELPFQLYTTILLGWITIVVLASVLPRLKLDILG